MHEGAAASAAAIASNSFIIVSLGFVWSLELVLVMLYDSVVRCAVCDAMRWRLSVVGCRSDIWRLGQAKNPIVAKNHYWF